jgi:beta-glucanase (GH16 family)
MTRTRVLVKRVAIATAFTIAASAGVAALGPVQSATATSPSSLYTLTFDDEFNGTAVDTTKWDPRTDAKQNSVQQAANLSESGGALHIALKSESVTRDGKTYAFTGGGVVSKQRFRYGYYETRAKINTGPGWHSSFWAQCTDDTSTASPCRKMEIDGFEIDSKNPGTIRNNIFDWPAGGAEYTSNPYQPTGYSPAFDSSSDWHTYGFLYTDTGVQFYLDDQPVFYQKYTGSAHVEDWMNLWFSTIAYNDYPDVSQLPATVDVDYIRYYQKDIYVDNDGPTATGYTENGTWATSSLLGWGKSTSRWAYGSSGANASWSATVPANGTYDVSAYVPGDSSNSPDASYTVTHDGTATTNVVNTGGSSRWIDLGSYSLTAGTTQSVSVTAPDGVIRADSVRFVRTS